MKNKGKVNLFPILNWRIITLHLTATGSKVWSRELLEESRLAHLATCKAGIPHVVPICYVYDGKNMYTPVDEKPKRSKPRNLRRLVNISANPHVCIVVDHYEEDWKRLKFTILLGKARIITRGREYHGAIRRLRKKYSQYRSMNLESCPIIKISPSKLIIWNSSSSPTHTKVYY
ncbi:MAG TPA: TIGR03668 family PPOX class F420-dependent oxidoreductase [Candidatus Bathyarchaeia archaeon]|nr:TIGR03668 family PPOX class F420-dependent oxidoreductase [Candidatus Bathyarchaeia archaeon]